MVAEPSGPKVAFVDTSQYRGTVDAKAVANSGKVGLFPRTSFRTSVDPLWTETIQAALDAGLVGMARHRIYGTPNVATQFDVFKNAAERAVPGMPGILICLDSEDDASWSQVADFEQRCHDRWGVYPVAYYPCWWLRGIGNPTLRSGQVFWHSRYASSPGDLCGGRTSLAGQMWQHTQSGTCPGVNPPVDLNWFYGTRAELEALAVGGGEDLTTAEAKEAALAALRQWDSERPANLAADPANKPLTLTEVQGVWGTGVVGLERDVKTLKSQMTEVLEHLQGGGDAPTR